MYCFSSRWHWTTTLLRMWLSMCFTSVSPCTPNALYQTGLTTIATSSGTCINYYYKLILLLFLLLLEMNASDFHSIIIILIFKNMINKTSHQLFTYCRPKGQLKLCSLLIMLAHQVENGGLLCEPCARHHAASSAAGHHWQNQRASQSVWNSVFSCSHPRVTGTTTHIVISCDLCLKRWGSQSKESTITSQYYLS